MPKQLDYKLNRNEFECIPNNMGFMFGRTGYACVNGKYYRMKTSYQDTNKKLDGSGYTFCVFVPQLTVTVPEKVTVKLRERLRKDAEEIEKKRVLLEMEMNQTKKHKEEYANEILREEQLKKKIDDTDIEDFDLSLPY